MRFIKNWKHFESLDLTVLKSDFPDIEEVKTYFYDIMDEINDTPQHFRIGYTFFSDISFQKRSLYNIDPKKEDKIIDILNTNLGNLRLAQSDCFIDINSDINKKDEIRFKNALKSGLAWECIKFQFNEGMFKAAHLEILVDCLKNFYSHTGFRPYEKIWEEDYIRGNELETGHFFAGEFIRCSDEVYNKFCEIYDSEENNHITSPFEK